MTSKTWATDMLWSLQQRKTDVQHCKSCDGYGCMACDYEPTRTEAEIAEEERRRWGDEQVDRRRGETMNQLAAFTVWTDAVRRGITTEDEMTRWLKCKALQSALRELEAMDLIKFFNEVKR